jgi:hypothetical protein
MRTALFLLAGLFLMAAALILAKLFAPELPAARQWTLLIASGLWLTVTGFNFWVGVSKAGYSFRDELPIFLMLFAVPAAAALLARRWLP